MSDILINMNNICVINIPGKACKKNSVIVSASTIISE